MSSYYRADQINEFLTFAEYSERAGISLKNSIRLAGYGELDFYLHLQSSLIVYHEHEGNGPRPAAILRPGIYRMHQDTIDLLEMDLSAINPFFDMGNGWLASPLDDFRVSVTMFLIHANEFERSTGANISDQKELDEIAKFREVPVNAKSKNSYLRTINSLVTALIEGKTGRPSTDAQAVILALDSAGIKSPIDERTLANYLKEADKLSD